VTRTGIYEGQLAMDAALGRTTEQWTEAARFAVERFGYRGAEFSAEDIREKAGDPPGSPNALGALLHALETEGAIKVVGYRRSSRPSSHGRRILVWRRA
jgi:hypothetical protein